MDAKVLNKIREITEKAKGKSNAVNVRLKSGGVDSLSEVIKTKERAEEFMRNLRACI
jgi:hypothetical protein